MHIFLKREEKDKLAKWQYSVDDKSITTQLFTSWWNYIVTWVPETVAPNILSLAGLLCILFYFQLAYDYASTNSMLVSLSGFVLIFAYITLDAIDGKHARRTGNSSPLGELFDHTCDNVSVPFMTVGLTLTLGITNMTFNWYLVQTSQIVFLLSHIEAFRKRVVEFGRWTGPGEVLHMYLLVLLTNALFGFRWFYLGFEAISLYFNMTPDVFSVKIMSTLYYLTLVYFFLYIYRIDNKHSTTKKGLLISIAVRTIPSFMIHYGLFSKDVDLFTVVCHGVIMSILTGDMIVSKMASRELHPLVPILIMGSMFSNFLCLAGAFCYYFIILSEISFYLRIPVFGVKRIVFINGVFDLCHQAHVRLCQESAKEGTYLIVGVLAEEDVLKYKKDTIKKPAMSFDQRCAAISQLGVVDKVIQSPFEIKGEEGDKFLKEHGIDVVMISSEYDQPDDQWYESPRRLGKIKVLPRMGGISTTKLKKQVIDRCTDSK